MKRYKCVAKYYDAENARLDMLRHDVPFFLGQMQKKPQDVLEIAVGTARAAIPIAQAGHRVTGVDYVEDMLEIARQKRDSVGLTDKQLKLIRQDALKLKLGKKFDWVCIFFNTLLAFVSLEELDAVFAGVRKHLKPSGRFYIDIFNPDYARLTRPKEKGIERDVFFVPELNRTVFRWTDIERDTARQVMRVHFKYRWFDEFGSEKNEQFSFDMGWIFVRELQMLAERHGMVLEVMWGNYDGSKLDNNSPRILARCALA